MKLITLILLSLICSDYLIGQTQPIQPIGITVPGLNVDSMAIWIAPKKSESLVLLTEKAGGQIMVFKADKNATFVKRFGEMQRPNGISIIQKVKFAGKNRDLAFVTERDGNLVSIYSIPDFEKIGEFANNVPQPMGVSLYRDKKNLFAFVVAKHAAENDKVIKFWIIEKDGKIASVRETQFGKELTPNQETVFVDEKRKILFVADETAKNIKVYDLNGNWQKTFGDGSFQAQVEGIGIIRCRKTDFLIASDQLDTTEFEIFDLKDFRHIGTVLTTAKHTDGIALTQTKLLDFPNGLFIAQSDPLGDGGRQAEFFDLNKILEKVNVVCH